MARYYAYILSEPSMQANDNECYVVETLIL